MPTPPVGPGYSSEIIPNGLDTADGLNGHPGTPTNPDAIEVQPSATFFEEFPDSPDLERAEQGTFQHRFRMDVGTGNIYIAGLGRGALQTDDSGNQSKILSARLMRKKGNQCELHITAESISFDTPPDDFSLSTIELNPALEKHPRYAFLPADIRNLINQAVNGSQLVSQNEAVNLVSSIASRDPATLPIDPDTGSTVTWNWNTAYLAAKELLLKRRIGEDTFYLPGFRVSWIQYFYMPQALNPGGYIEDPITEGGLPAYFWSLNQEPDGNDIFTLLADYNPQFFSDGISWFRQSDDYQYVRTWFRISKTWIGAPYAHWDADVYSQFPSPYPPPPLHPY